MEKTYPVDDVEIAIFYLKSGNTITIPLCGFEKDEDGRNMSWDNVEVKGYETDLDRCK